MNKKFFKKILYPLSYLNKLVKKNENKILLYSNLGFRDNVKSIFDYLINNGYNKKYQIICSLDDYENYTDNHIKNVKFISNIQGVYHYLTSKYCFYCFGKYPIKPSKKQIVINLWHGMPLKKIGNMESNNRKVPLSQEEIFKFAKKRNPFNHMTVMFKKDKVLEVGNYRKVMDIGYEDYDLWVRILKAGFKVKNIDIPTVKVRTGKDMLKRRGDKKRLKTALYFRKYLLNIGFISRIEWLVYSFFTIVFVFSPVSIKGWAYKNLLRK